METKLLYEPLDRVEADAVAVVLFEESANPAELNFASAWVDELRASGEFAGARTKAEGREKAGVETRRRGG
jgi:hypothetical protein